MDIFLIFLLAVPRLLIAIHAVYPRLVLIYDFSHVFFSLQVDPPNLESQTKLNHSRETKFEVIWGHGVSEVMGFLSYDISFFLVGFDFLFLNTPILSWLTPSTDLPQICIVKFGRTTEMFFALLKIPIWVDYLGKTEFVNYGQARVNDGSNYIVIFVTETISRTDKGQPRPKYIFNKCGTNIYFLYSTEVWSITITEF